jgi:NAD(P)-dependent dehydrogenase (short-subunit alcohol dehydrogenase family)
VEKLQDKVAVITGAGSGIGRAAALALAREGVRVVLVGRRPEPLASGAREITEMGVEALPFPGDVAEPDLFERVRDAALNRFGRVDIVMNNVATICTGLPEDIPVREWQRAFDVNFMAVVRSNHAFLPLLMGQGEGHLVNVASVDGIFGFGYDRLPYAASKAALVQLSEGLALYLRPQGIGVTCLCPGPVHTEIASGLRSVGRAHDIHGAGVEFEHVSSAEVGDLVVDAIRRDRVLVFTHDGPTRAKLKQRADDMESFVEQQIEHAQVIFRYEP